MIYELFEALLLPCTHCVCGLQPIVPMISWVEIQRQVGTLSPLGCEAAGTTISQDRWVIFLSAFIVNSCRNVEQETCKHKEQLYILDKQENFLPGFLVFIHTVFSVRATTLLWDSALQWERVHCWICCEALWTLDFYSIFLKGSYFSDIFIMAHDSINSVFIIWIDSHAVSSTWCQLQLLSSQNVLACSWMI